MGKIDDEKKTKSLKQKAKLIISVIKMVIKTSPAMAVTMIVDAIVRGALPMATTYVVAQTTSCLAAAVAGDSSIVSQLYAYILAGGVLVAAGAIWGIYVSYASTNMYFVISARLADMMWRKYYHLDFSYYDNKKTADLYENAREFAGGATLYFHHIVRIITALIGLASAIGLLLTVNIWLTVIGLVLIIPNLYLTVQRSRKNIKIRRSNADNRRYMWSMTSLMNDPDNVMETRLYGLGEFLISKNAELRAIEQDMRMANERHFLPMAIGQSILRYGFEVGAMVWAAMDIVAGRQPIGNFVLVQRAVSTLMERIDMLVGAIQLLDDMAALTDFEEFMSLPDGEEKGIKVGKVVENVDIKDVSFKYPETDREVLKSISLSINKGDHIAIVGRNGAGKSTLMKLICGLYQPTGGEIDVNGKKLARYNLSDWHNRIAMLTQDFTKYTFATIRENVLFGDVTTKFDQARYDKALADSGANIFIDKLPHGDQTFADSWTSKGEVKGTRLSGGQWQRLALARSFYRNAPIIILDEPTSAIDAIGEAKIFDKVFGDNNKTIIAVSHRLSTIKKADKIFMLADGKIVESGSCDELLAQKGEFYNMFKSQI